MEQKEMERYKRRKLSWRKNLDLTEYTESQEKLINNKP